jgi:hypothetical protein
MKTPAYADRIVLANGGVIERSDGTDIIAVSADGATTTITGTEVISPGEIPLAENKALVGNSSGVGSEKTVSATFTGTAPAGSLNLATPAFSGTGLTAAGQAMTTTDNQTMTLNQCAGMWLIPATGATPPMLILSNTAVTAAPAVLTVQGSAATDAGAYKIVKSISPVGTVAISYS